MQIERVQIKHSTSRGRDTYGYNIVTAVADGKSYRTYGGGYDMIGTVLADWFEDAHQADLTALATTIKLEPYVNTTIKLEPYVNTTLHAPLLYGLFVRDNNSVYLDGGCGLNSIRTIIEACGYQVQTCCNRRGYIEAFLVSKE